MMRYLAPILALMLALTGPAQGSVLTSRSLVVTTEFFTAPAANLVIDGPGGLIGLDTNPGDPLLVINGLTDPAGDPFEPGDFSLLLEDQVSFDFLSGIGVEIESVSGRFDLLVQRDGADGVFGATSAFVLVVIEGSFGDALSLTNVFNGTAKVAAFNTVSTVPLPASLPLLLGGIAALGLLRRRRRARAA